MPRVNEYGQLIGKDLSDWTVPPKPTAATLTGRACRLEPLNPSKHADDLFAAFNHSVDNRDWTYVILDGYETIEQCRKDIEQAVANSSVCPFAIIDLEIKQDISFLGN